MCIQILNGLLAAQGNYLEEDSAHEGELFDDDDDGEKGGRGGSNGLLLQRLQFCVSGETMLLMMDALGLVLT